MYTNDAMWIMQSQVVDHNTVFLLKIRHKNNDIAFSFADVWRLLFNILSACTFYSRLYNIAYMCDDLYRKLETIFNHSVKDAEQLEGPNF